MRQYWCPTEIEIRRLLLDADFEGGHADVMALITAVSAKVGGRFQPHELANCALRRGITFDMTTPTPRAWKGPLKHREALAYRITRDRTLYSA